MMTVTAYKTTYHNEEAICLIADPYEAVMLPTRGGNLIAFRDTKHNLQFLREPTSEQMDTVFRDRPFVFGIPVLFPPNRFENGQFTWHGQLYKFPINEVEYGNHLHGFLYNAKWKVDSFGADETESYVSVSMKIHEQHPIYQYFPHSFTIRIRYSLSSLGLSQHVRIHNEGLTDMPCMIAFHTTLNVPFAKDGSVDDYQFHATIGDRWELTNRMLPTENFQPLSENEKRIQRDFISPFFEPMDNHYTASVQNGLNYMELIDHLHRIKLIYDVGTAYREWMIWNNEAKSGFFCPEPQTSVINAPNLSLDREQTGIIALAPNRIWEETSRLYVIQF